MAPKVGIATKVGAFDQLAGIAVLGSYGGCVIILLLDYLDRSAQTRTSLIEQAVQLEIESLQQSSILEQVKAQLSADVEVELSTARDKLQARLQLEAEGIGPSGWLEISALLRDTSQTSVRPLSARLFRQTAKDYPQRSLLIILRAIVSGQPFRPMLIIVIHLLAGLKAVTELYGDQRGSVLIGLQCIVILAICKGANAFMRRFPEQHARIFIGALVLLESGVVITVNVREAWVPGSASLSWAAAQVVTGSAVVLLTSGLTAWRQLDAEAQTLFSKRARRRQLASIARSRQLADLAREASRILHGSVQTRLHACANAIDIAVEEDSSQERVAALREAMLILSQPLHREPPSNSLEFEIRRKVELWSGLCEFTIEVSGNALAPDSMPELVGRVIEEGISNAIRHGKATRIQIAVAATPSSCHIELIDNGRGHGGGKAGIGSALLSQASKGAWSLTNLDQGIRLQVEITM